MKKPLSRKRHRAWADYHTQKGKVCPCGSPAFRFSKGFVCERCYKIESRGTVAGSYRTSCGKGGSSFESEGFRLHGNFDLSLHD